MKNFILIHIYFYSSGCAFLLNKAKKEEVFPVYATSVWNMPREPKSYEIDDKYNNIHSDVGKESRRDGNDTIEIVIGSKYQVYDGNDAIKRKNDIGDKENSTRSYFEVGRRMDLHFENETEVTGRILESEYRKCSRTNGFIDCFKFKTLKFLKDLVVPIRVDNVSEVIQSDILKTAPQGPHLVGLPPPANKIPSEISDMMARAFGESDFGEIGQFITEQVDRFISRHGIVMMIDRIQGDQSVQLDTPWIVQIDDIKRVKRSSSAKLKKKELAIVFPLLVLFKFFKIKMVLLPILLTVLFIKKLLIVTLTFAPSVLGLLRLCRPLGFPPLGFQSAGILQEVDTRGEFSTNMGYATPYRDTGVYRQRDKVRPSDAAYPDY